MSSRFLEMAVDEARQLLTPEQMSDLYDAHIGDFILVERNDGYWYLLLIEQRHLTTSGRIGMLVKTIHNPERQTIFEYQRFGTWHAMCTLWSQEVSEIGSICSAEDTLTLRPSVETLRDRLGGGCLYHHCRDGLVRLNESTLQDGSFRPSVERKTASRAGQRPKTICRFCMGDELFQRHDYLALAWERREFPPGLFSAHLEIVHSKRVRLGYTTLPVGLDLNTLLPREQAIEGAMAGPAAGSSWSEVTPAAASTDSLTVNIATDRPEINIREWMTTAENNINRLATPPPGRSRMPILSTHTYAWYKAARERVFRDICGICRETYRDGESITDLRCEHFFHERCMRRCSKYQRGQAKCPLCNQAVNRVTS